MKAHLVNTNAIQLPFAAESVHCVVTSPPYWGLRDYGTPDQLGLEPTPEEYVANLVAVFREVWRVLRPDGTVWLNLGDSYAGSGGAGGDYAEGGLREGQPKYEGTAKMARINRSKRGGARWGGGNLPATDHRKPKDLVGVPWLVAFALQRDGWWLRQDIIWSKNNPMPESVRDRFTKSHEYIFLLTKEGPIYKWIHRDTREVVYSSPKPDYRWIHQGSGEETEKDMGDEEWKRHNLWQGRSYYFDQDAVREPLKESSLQRLSQDLDNQTGTTRANGGQKTNGNFNAVGDPERGRNRRSVWNISTKGFKGAHFAVFPPELPEVCIKSGTSEKGVCPECGAPWERVVDVERKDGREKLGDFQMNEDGVTRTTVGLNVPAEYKTSKRTTTGWRPLCQHEHDPVPATVLDVFGGSGTTAMVARQLGRRGIAIDINMEYLAGVARNRLGLDELDAWTSGKGKTVEANISDLPLFNLGG